MILGSRLRALSILVLLGFASCTAPSSPLSERDAQQRAYAQRIINGAEGNLAPVYAPLAAYVCERFALPDQDGVGIDIGSGPGDLIIELCSRTRMHWVNADLNPHFFAHFLDRAEAAGVGHRVSAMLSDAHELPFRGDYATVIVSRGTFHFWKDKAKAFSEIHRVLKPGGVAFIGRGFSPNLPAEDARRIRARQQADGFKMYDVRETEAELRQAMADAGITDYEIVLPRSPEDGNIHYGIWVEIRKGGFHRAEP